MGNMVTTNPYQATDRSWLIRQDGATGYGFTQGVMLDVSAFSATYHYPNGYIKAGVVLGKISASSTGGVIVVGPYYDSAADGRQTAWGVLFDDVKVPNLADLTNDPSGAAIVGFAVIKEARLPVSSAATTSGGYIDTNGKADLVGNGHFLFV